METVINSKNKNKHPFHKSCLCLDNGKLKIEIIMDGKMEDGDQKNRNIALKGLFIILYA